MTESSLVIESIGGWVKIGGHAGLSNTIELVFGEFTGWMDVGGSLVRGTREVKGVPELKFEFAVLVDVWFESIFFGTDDLVELFKVEYVDTAFGGFEKYGETNPEVEEDCCRGLGSLAVDFKERSLVGVWFEAEDSVDWTFKSPFGLKKFFPFEVSCFQVDISWKEKKYLKIIGLRTAKELILTCKVGMSILFLSSVCDSWLFVAMLCSIKKNQ